MEFLYSDNPKHCTILINEIKMVFCRTLSSTPAVEFTYKDGSEYSWYCEEQEEAIALYKKVQESLPGKIVTTKTTTL